MGRSLMIYNPTHNQHIKRHRLNVMGRVLDKKIKHVSAYLDKALIRRVRVANSGAFECRMDLEGLDGKHEVEVRAMIGHRTERLVIPVFVMLEDAREPVEMETDIPSAASTESTESAPPKQT